MWERCMFCLSCADWYLFLLSVYRQQALLAAISEKDANIALLELSASGKKKTQEEVLALKREKDRLMHQLKQQVRTGDTTQVDILFNLYSGSIPFQLSQFS